MVRSSVGLCVAGFEAGEEQRMHTHNSELGKRLCERCKRSQTQTQTLVAPWRHNLRPLDLTSAIRLPETRN